MSGAPLSPDGPLVGAGSEITDSRLGPYTEIGADCLLLNVELGAYSYCHRGCDLANARIGKFSNIASSVRIGATDHPLHGASLHHFLYRSSRYFEGVPDDAAFFATRALRLAHIGHDTWIGHGAQVRPEVRIGDGAVVAAGAIATRDVAPYTIVAGIPARPLRERIAPALAERMMALAWWDWPHETLAASLEDFRTLGAEAFLEKHGG